MIAAPPQAGSAGWCAMRSFLLPGLLCCGVLSGCTTRQADEWVIRHEFGIPANAKALVYEATPAEPGWFGREGLRITMVFGLSEGDYNALTRKVATSGNWQPLPIPESTLEHLAGIRSARAARIRLAQESGETLQPEGSVYNPTDGQRMTQFRQSMPAHPRTGWYQIRTAGTDIMHAPKTVRTTLNKDVNDFMLALLDPKQHTVMVRVSTNY